MTDERLKELNALHDKIEQVKSDIRAIEDVYARDEEHTKKKAADSFAKWKAEQEGIT